MICAGALWMEAGLERRRGCLPLGQQVLRQLRNTKRVTGMQLWTSVTTFWRSRFMRFTVSK
jgi:hypothetical protein